MASVTAGIMSVVRLVDEPGGQREQPCPDGASNDQAVGVVSAEAGGPTDHVVGEDRDLEPRRVCPEHTRREVLETGAGLEVFDCEFDGGVLAMEPIDVDDVTVEVGEERVVTLGVEGSPQVLDRPATAGRTRPQTYRGSTRRSTRLSGWRRLTFPSTSASAEVPYASGLVSGRGPSICVGRAGLAPERVQVAKRDRRRWASSMMVRTTSATLVGWLMVPAPPPNVIGMMLGSIFTRHSYLSTASASSVNDAGTRRERSIVRSNTSGRW